MCARAADCIIRDALTSAEAEAVAVRAAEQAQAELEAGIAEYAEDSPRYQVSSLVNKGSEFVSLIAHEASHRVVEHILGAEMQLSTSNAILVRPGSTPMGLHTDQWWMPQPQRKVHNMRINVGDVNRRLAHSDEWASESAEFIAPPVAAQTIFMASDFRRDNGAT